MNRLPSYALFVAALAVGLFVVRQVMRNDDAGPPMGALCTALPAFVLLITASALWPKGGR